MYAIVFTPKVVLLYLGVALLVVALAATALERGGIEVRLTPVELLALALLGWGFAQRALRRQPGDGLLRAAQLGDGVAVLARLPG